MPPEGAAFAIRLVAIEREADVAPAGLVLPCAAAAPLLARLRRSAPHGGLRLALAGDLAVLFATDAAPLPWCEVPLAWLDRGDVLYLPSGLALDAPAPLRSAVARRLLERHGLAGPAALLPPHGADGRPRLLDLSAARALRDIDHGRLDLRR